MHYSLLLPLSGLAAFVLYKVISTLLISQRRAGTRLDTSNSVDFERTVADMIVAKARQLNCQDAPAYPGLGPLGYKGVQQMLKADKEQLFSDLLVERQNNMEKFTGRRCLTYRVNNLGQTQVGSIIPLNQALWRDYKYILTRCTVRHLRPQEHSAHARPRICGL